MPTTLWIAIGASLLLGATLLFQHFEIGHLDSELAMLTYTNQQLTNANKAFAASVQKQNAALSLLQGEAQKQVTAAAGLVAQAQVKTAFYQRQATALLALRPTGDECAAAKAVMASYFNALGDKNK